MGSHRSTTLGIFARHCPAALDHHERGTPYLRDHFASGVAAHAVLQALAEQPHADPAEVARLTAIELASKGRSFDARPEPALPIDAVNEGARLALAWHATHPIPEDAQPEIGLAVDERWQPVSYSAPTARLRAILDLRYPAVEDVDGEPYYGLAHLDYKSAYSASADDLDSLQMKIQTLITLAHADEPSFIRQEIGALRTQQTHTRIVWIDDAGQDLIASWRRDVEIAMAAADVQPRQARPGAGCPGCPYLHACAPARDLIDAVTADPERYAVIDAERTRLRALIAAQAASARLPIPGGYVGYVGIERRTPKPDALIALGAQWHDIAPEDRADWQSRNAAWTGLLGAIPPTMGAVNALAAAIHPRRARTPYKEARAALIESMTDAAIVTELQIVREETP